MASSSPRLAGARPLSEHGCPLCRASTLELVWQSPIAIAIHDLDHVVPGHTIIAPRRHVESYFDTTEEERADIWRAVSELKMQLDAALHPDGYNLTIDVGVAAGQSGPHACLHLVPRRSGDSVEFGRVAATRTVLTAGRGDPFAPHLLRDLDRARHADLAVAFVFVSGLREGVLTRLGAMLEHEGSRVRILVGDYQDVTEPAALRMLLNLKEQVAAGVLGKEASLDLRVFETGAACRSFHPKAYLLYEGVDHRPLAAYVGSSNLTATALVSNAVEWNLRFVDHGEEVRGAFEGLFDDPQSKLLTHAWVRAYEQRRRPPLPGGARQLPVEAPPPEEPAPEMPTPHGVQLDALAALERTREGGNRRGLVVLATGLGKTWLAAFDSVRDRGFGRVLFVAHREEILRQAMATFAAIRPDDDLGLYSGDEKDGDADVVFASVMTLGRERHLERFARNAFDYVVIDEFHHAAAATYRRILDYFDPTFMLGLTATPERTDGGDLLGLCHENLVFDCSLAEGIRHKLLCPFHYYGVPDDVEYEQIPWRSRRFDEEALTTAVATSARAQNALDQLRARGGRRTLGFCVSRRHADFMREYFVEAGLHAASVHSGDTSDPRQTSLERLASGELDVIFCVDIFNEGLDVPSIDTVLMLRPTESKIIWLQQLGRGLRLAHGKERLNVIDYIGNHRVFLNKPEALLGAFGKIVRSRREIPLVLRRRDFELPPGCEVTYDVEALEILDRLYPPTAGAFAIREWYEEFREANERRPTALEAYHCDYNPGALRVSYGGWFRFVRDMDDLDEHERRESDVDAALLDALEAGVAGSGDAIVVLQAMIQLGALPGSATLPALGDACVRIADRSAKLRQDVGSDVDDRGLVAARLRSGAIARLAKEKDAGGRALFTWKEDVLATGDGVVGERPEALTEMCRELLDWRLARYLDEARAGATFRVIRNASGNPILRIDRSKQSLPEGWVGITIDGAQYQANFVKEFINVVRRDGEGANVLPTLMRGWFGADAGRPGTTHSVAQDHEVGGGYVWRRANQPERHEGTQILDADGKPLDARFLVEERDGVATVVIMSRGAGRNDEYNAGLETLLQRLAAMGASIERIAIESGDTKHLDLAQRSLELTYPIALGPDTDVEDLRKQIGRESARTGRKPGAKGQGNATKRIRLWVAGVSLAQRELLRGVPAAS